MSKDTKELENMIFEANLGRKPNILERAKIRISVLSRSFASKLKDTAAVISGKKLANNKQYEGASRVSQEDVEAEPRRWIIEECVPACQILWDKNIYTFMCSDGLDIDAWIELELECLSPENKGILEQIKCEYDCYQYHEGCINIPVKGKGKSAQEELINIANRFVMQDVPSKYSTCSMESVYIKNGCYKVIDNPDYVPIEEQLANMTFENWKLDIQEPTMTVFDSSKITRSDEEYIEAIGAIKDTDTGVIYRSQFHYNKHLKYLEFLEKGKRL